jgi:thiol-disulfide isomerase/thioredoxin
VTPKPNPEDLSPVRLTNFSPHIRFTAAAIALLALSPHFASAASAHPAPSFTVKTLEGKPLKSSDMRQKPMILDFWATWCGPCRASMPHLSAMQTRYEKQGLTVIGLSVDESGPQGVKKFASQLGVKFTLAMANDDVLDAYGPIRSIPTTFFINRKGDIVRRVVGYIDGETMEDYVKEILQ